MSDLHRRLERWSGFRLHRWYLAAAYRAGYEQLRRMGADPLARAGARVLLCGTGSAETSLAFARFVRERNPSASLVVLDLSARPLVASRALVPGAGWLRADARALPIAGESIDLIETDFFLQYFEPEAKRVIAAEWSRVLAPGGAIMSRDYVLDGSASVERLLDRGRRALFRRTLGIDTFSVRRLELAEIFGAAGLTLALKSPRGVPLVKMLAAVSSDGR